MSGIAFTDVVRANHLACTQDSQTKRRMNANGAQIGEKNTEAEVDEPKLLTKAVHQLSRRFAAFSRLGGGNYS